MSSVNCSLFLVACFAAALCVAMAVQAADSESSRTDSIAAESQKSAIAVMDVAGIAAQWGLSEPEYVRYQQLMKHSPRGNWTPGLDPLSVLGIEAQTTQEQQRYAELYVRLEHQRFAREKAFIAAIGAAQARLYPGEKPFQFSVQPRQNAVLHSGDRLVLLTGKSCNDCAERIAKLLGRLGNDNVLDVFVVGLKGDDALRRWASEQRIDIDAVKQGRVTLNHERGELLTMQIAESALPVVLQRSATGAMAYYPP